MSFRTTISQLRLALGVRKALVCASLIVASTSSIWARSLDDIKQTGTIRICIAPVHPATAIANPPDCTDECEFSGSAYELALAFTETLGPSISAILRRVDWHQQFHNSEGETILEASYTPELLASGACDLYPANLTKNEWRSKKLSFVTLFPSRMMVVVHKSQKAQFKTAADLAGKTAAILKDTSYHSWLQEQNDTVFADAPVQIKLVGAEERIAIIDAGDADFTMLDANLAIWSTRHQAKNTVVALAVGQVDEIGWALRKDDRDLQAAVQAFFDHQRADPNSDLNRSWKKTYGLSMTQFIALVTAIK